MCLKGGLSPKGWGLQSLAACPLIGADKGSITGDICYNLWECIKGPLRTSIKYTVGCLMTAATPRIAAHLGTSVRNKHSHSNGAIAMQWRIKFFKKPFNVSPTALLPCSMHKAGSYKINMKLRIMKWICINNCHIFLSCTYRCCFTFL